MICCSACRDRVNERVKVVIVLKVAKVVKVKECEFIKFFKTFLVPSFCLTFRHFFQSPFNIMSRQVVEHD